MKCRRTKWRKTSQGAAVSSPAQAQNGPYNQLGQPCPSFISSMQRFLQTIFFFTVLPSFWYILLQPFFTWIDSLPVNKDIQVIKGGSPIRFVWKGNLHWTLAMGWSGITMTIKHFMSVWIIYKALYDFLINSCTSTFFLCTCHIWLKLQKWLLTAKFTSTKSKRGMFCQPFCAGRTVGWAIQIRFSVFVAQIYWSPWFDQTHG